VIFFNISYLAETFLLRFFPPPSVREMIVFFDKTIAKRTPLGQRQSVQNEGVLNSFSILNFFIHLSNQIISFMYICATMVSVAVSPVMPNILLESLTLCSPRSSKNTPSSTRPGQKETPQ
jgi:hypothetical protein